MLDIFRKGKLLIQGKLPDYDEFLMLVKENSQLKKIKFQHEEQIKLLQGTRKENMVPVAGFDDLSHEPIDSKERMRYAGSVSDFYDSILKVKIRTSVAEIRELLSNVGFIEGVPHNINRNQYDFFLRGMEAGLWKISQWAEMLQAELKDK